MEYERDKLMAAQRESSMVALRVAMLDGESVVRLDM
jgi:hypothetical protein